MGGSREGVKRRCSVQQQEREVLTNKGCFESGVLAEDWRNGTGRQRRQRSGARLACCVGSVVLASTTLACEHADAATPPLRDVDSPPGLGEETPNGWPSTGLCSMARV